MKNSVFFLLTFFMTTCLSAQGGSPPYLNSDPMYIYNYSSYTIFGGRITAKDEAACWPAVSGNLGSYIQPYNDPSGQWFTELRKFWNTHLANVPVNYWTVYTSSSDYAGNYQHASDPIWRSYENLAGLGGFLAEYGYSTGGVLGPIPVGYQYNNPSFCYNYPWNYTDANISVASFHIGNDYYIVVS